MSFDPALFARAQNRLSARRAAREAEVSARRQALYERLPELRTLDAQMRAGMIAALKTALLTPETPDEGENGLLCCRDRNLALMERRRGLLTRNGLPAGALDDTPDCAVCDDAGFIDGRVCACLRAAYIAEQEELLLRTLDIRRQCFETFDMSLFSSKLTPGFDRSARENMRDLFSICKKYVLQFGLSAPSLLFSGPPGTGKTFLAACVAGDIHRRGFWVVYETAAALFSLLEADKFARDADAHADARRFFQCDLLMVDDLGTEFLTPFVQSALYNLINARLTARRPTLLITAEDPLRYAPQTLSRIEGAFVELVFLGRDLRRIADNG